MGDAVTGASTELIRTVDLPRHTLWDLITDVTRFGEWSPECIYGAWLDTASPGPRAGARFQGRSRYPDGFVSQVVCEVTEATEPSVFAWVVLDETEDAARPGSIWRYELSPADTPDRTRLLHRFEHGPGITGTRLAAERDPASLPKRLRDMNANMAATVDAMLRHAHGRV
ncbi:SRPBCC family protein [Streptomyces sp. NPDC050418]|uniref:SRPBCC family protein n=1 Tax=Streptomyces sp. NPDC050418 TaxID=3365612 RepID=UPI00379D1DCA